MIDFTFTEEQDMFRKAAGEFAETKIAPKVAEMEQTAEVSADVVKAMGEAEMMAITIPEEYGGLGITVSYWKDRESINQWKNHAAHRLAQQFGRDKWYRSYRIRVAKVEKEYGS